MKLQSLASTVAGYEPVTASAITHGLSEKFTSAEFEDEKAACQRFLLEFRVRAGNMLLRQSPMMSAGLTLSRGLTFIRNESDMTPSRFPSITYEPINPATWLLAHEMQSTATD